MSTTQEQKQKIIKAYKRTFKGVCGALTRANFRKGNVRLVNRAQVAICEANALRREPMFRERDKRRKEAIARHRDDYLNQRYNHSNAASFNGARKP